MIGIERLADVFVDVADTLVADFDVIEFLHTVAGHATEMTGATAAGLMLSDLDGGLHYMGASDESARLLELFQIQHEEGPCLDCYRDGHAGHRGRPGDGDARGGRSSPSRRWRRACGRSMPSRCGCETR